MDLIIAVTVLVIFMIAIVVYFLDKLNDMKDRIEDLERGKTDIYRFQSEQVRLSKLNKKLISLQNYFNLELVEEPATIIVVKKAQLIKNT